MINLDHNRIEQIKRETAESVAANFGPAYEIIDRRTGSKVGEAKTLKGARRSVDRRDRAYGSYNHAIREAATGRTVL